jgi:hypothetical protein
MENLEKININLNKGNSIFYSIQGFSGERLGNNIGPFFRTINYIYQTNLDILYKFIYEELSLVPLISKYTIYCQYNELESLQKSSIHYRIHESNIMKNILSIPSKIVFYSYDILNLLLTQNNQKFLTFIQKMINTTLKINTQYQNTKKKN